MKIYKKVTMIFVLCVTMGTILFFTDRNVMTTYAYTEEEKAAAKAWLSQNGYPPTMDGAQQAYQDYLDGKFGPVGGSETPEDSEPQTPDETNKETGETTPPASQDGDSATEEKTEEKEGSSDSEPKTEEQDVDTGSETKEITQKEGAGSETKEVTQKDGAGSRTKTEEKEGSSDSKTKAASQKEKSDLGTKPVEKKQTGNKSTEVESNNLLASDDGKSENQEGSDIGIGAENSEDSSVNNEISAEDLNTAKQSKMNVILIMAVIGAIVLIYFIWHFYIGNKREKCQRQQ